GSRRQGSDRFSDTWIERFLQSLPERPRHEGIAVMQGERLPDGARVTAGQDFESLGQGQPDNSEHVLPGWRYQPVRLEGIGHRRTDVVLAVDQGPIAVENHEHHGGTYNIGLSEGVWTVAPLATFPCGPRIPPMERQKHEPLGSFSSFWARYSR